MFVQSKLRPDGWPALAAPDLVQADWDNVDECLWLVTQGTSGQQQAPHAQHFDVCNVFPGGQLNFKASLTRVHSDSGRRHWALPERQPTPCGPRHSALPFAATSLRTKHGLQHWHGQPEAAGPAGGAVLAGLQAARAAWPPGSGVDTVRLASPALGDGGGGGTTHVAALHAAAAAALPPLPA